MTKRIISIVVGLPLAAIFLCSPRVYSLADGPGCYSGVWPVATAN
jgi:hypothetical protein